MNSSDFSARLHISGTDETAPALARDWNCGYEVTAFCYAPNLSDEALVSRVAEECRGVRSLWLHAPFAELIPCAIDPDVRAIAAVRFRQTVELAQRLGIGRIVFHGGFIPLVYYPVWYVEQSVQFWREFLQTLPSGMQIAVENVMEPGPDTLVEIARSVDDPRFGLCLDFGHANTIISKTPPLDWLAPMLPWLRHVHLHDNHGEMDEHLPLGAGTMPIPEILDALAQQPQITVTLENMDAAPSLRYLQARGYL